ncbi:MAG: OmpA family protein [Terracidiphilus sp.]
MYSQTLKAAFRVLAVVCVAALPLTLTAQSSAPSKAAPPTRAAYGDTASKWDIFAGYSYLAPKGTVETPQANGTTLPVSYQSIDWGAILSVTRYFSKNVGLEAIGDEHIVNETPCNCGSGSTYSNGNFSGGSAGIIFRFPTEDITPFVHGLAGGELVGGPNGQPDKWGPVLTAGGGVDYRTPLFNHHLSIRVFQADYQYIHENWGPVVGGGRANVNAARLSAGFVIHAGSLEPPAPPTLACAAEPGSVFQGEPVTVTATPSGLDPKAHVVYTWSGDGVSGADTKANVNTAAQAPGTYTVNCALKEGKTGKEGLKPWQNAQSTASYTVKAFEPPTISCSADPSTIKPGETATITATAASPQSRPLTYSYSAASGTISGTGNTATFNSAGAPSGPVEITCNVADDKGHTGSATTTETIQPPPPPPSPEKAQLEARLALHSVFFPTNEPRVQNPTGGLLSSQQGTLMSLATDFKRYLQLKPDAQLTLTGHTDVRGPVEFNQKLSARRVESVKQFLVDQGVPASSIQTEAVGEEHQLTADEVKDLVDQNTQLTSEERTKIQRNLKTIVLAQNRRVDITLSTTGQKSVRLYPFNAQDAETLLSEKAPAPKKKPAAKKK